MAATEKKLPVTGAGPFNGLLTWIDQRFPLLTLWRKEEPDSGGPGRKRGGLSGSVAIMPYGTEVPLKLVVASSGKAVSQNNGIAGGYPGNTAIGIIASDPPAEPAHYATTRSRQYPPKWMIHGSRSP